MAISLKCRCGKSFRIKDDLAGRKIRCRDCGKVLEVPAADESDVEEVRDERELAESEEEERVVRRKRRDEEEERVVRRKRRDEDDQAPADEESHRSREERDPPRRPRRRKPVRERSERVPRVAFERGWFGNVNGGIAAGVLMMIIAVAWFVAGIVWANRIFFYPPILFVIGIVAIVKGLMGGE